MTGILICDDERDIVSALKIYLSGEDYRVYEAYNGREALESLKAHGDIRLVLLDIMMPEVDGITALAGIRAVSNVPVILLSAKSEEADKVLGLGVGADDYITKPYSPVELLARVRSQLRRYTQLGGGTEGDDLLRIGGIELCDREKKVTLDGEEITLTPTEYDILKFLMEHAGEVFSPKEIYARTKGENPYGSENTVAVHIRHLREKLEIDPGSPRYIKVVWGQGYKMEKGEMRK
ncbi:MAG: response regulator transcription factor [Clostridia bacterium]|nr:response regulator transcription factor [Clostridia bacterium]